MLGIADIAVYFPEKRIDNYKRKERFNITEDFIENKIGVKKTAHIEPNQSTSDFCCQAYEKLRKKRTEFNENDIDLIAVCSQNPDYNLPHTAAVVHGKLGLPENCASFDISLGCSGYVYSLAIVQGFMAFSNMKKGILFTADPYTTIIDRDDKNTSLLFGDAATATLINCDPVFRSAKFTFGTQGESYKNLICIDKKLQMNGRGIFNYAARAVPKDIEKVMEINNLNIDDIDYFLLHQGSKYIHDFLVKRAGLPKEKTPFSIQNYGNTVSSSIPILLSDLLFNSAARRILISGFGVGLSIASGILERVKNGGFI